MKSSGVPCICLFVTITAATICSAADTLPSAVRVIREEALRKNSSPDGRPLPLAAHWHRRYCPLSYQIEQISRGHHLLPWLPTPVPQRDGNRAFEGNEDGLRQLRKWKLPFALITGGQWEATLYDHQQRWRSLPPEKSPLVVPVEPIRGKDGKIKPTAKQLSPFGAIEPWREIGKVWMGSPGMKAIQQAYPDPPMVLIVSNNEAHDLRWHEVEDESKRYLDKYGKGRDGEFKRKVVAEGWIERYQAMLDAMRGSLIEDDWKKKSRFVAYNAMGPNHIGRWDAWKTYSLITKDYVDPGPIIWDGAIPAYYDNHWQPQKSIWGAWSCQTEAMNMALLKEEALRIKPEFWHEVIFWDGNLPGKDNDRYQSYTEMGFPPSPQRYRGWVQYGMWLLTPRVAREWRSSADKRKRWEAYFNAIVGAVDLVHTDKVLTRFWRKGELVQPAINSHPFQSNVPQWLEDRNRWYHLRTSLDPEYPLKLDSVLPVFTLARVIGEKPNRQWLLYGHAPKGDKKHVEVEIPGHKKVTVDVSLSGSFYQILEEDGVVKPVGDISWISETDQGHGPVSPEKRR